MPHYASAVLPGSRHTFPARVAHSRPSSANCVVGRISGVPRGGQGGTYVPGRQGIGAPKWGLQKFHNKGKKPVTRKIAPAADIYS